MKSRYYINPDTEELIIVTENKDGESTIEQCPLIESIEWADEEEESEEESEEEEQAPAPKPKKSAGGGRSKKEKESAPKSGNASKGKRLSEEDKQTILRMSAEGKLIPEIARAVGCSAVTVYNVKKSAAKDRLDEEDRGISL